MATENKIITAIRDRGTEVQNAHQMQGENWHSFLQETENLLREAQKKAQDNLQQQQDFSSKLDQELQTLEQDIGKKSGLLASLSATNILAKQEQVGQKRMALLQSLKQNRDSLTQLADQIIALTDHVVSGSQQLQQDNEPVQACIQKLQADLVNLDQEFKNLQAQAQAPASTQSPNQADPANAPSPPADSISAEVLTKLGQAETALLNLKQVLEKSRLLQKVADNINEFGHSYSLH